MPRKHIQLGPWVEGLHNAYADDVAPAGSFVDGDHFELDAKGSLRIRRGFRLVNSALTGMTNVNYYNTVYINTIPYSVFSGVVGGIQNLYLVSCDAANVVTALKLNFDFTGNTITSIVYYDTQLWVISSSGNSYFSDKFTIPVAGINFTPITTGPDTGTKLLGSSAIVHKNRLFIISSQAEATVYYSGLYDFKNWNFQQGAGAIIIGAGDGQFIMQLLLVYDNIYIFKSSITYALTYSGNPGDDGAVTAVSKQNGAVHATIAQSNVYVVSPTSVYLFLNNMFYDLAENINLELDRNCRLVALEDMLLVGTVSGIFAMNLITRKWTIFSKDHALFMNQQPRNTWPYGFGTAGTYKVPVTNTGQGMQFLEWRYGVQAKFTDQTATGEAFFYPEVTLRSTHFGDASFYKRIYYCTLEGAYEGPDNLWRIRIFDTINNKLMETQAFPRVDIVTKARYPLDRTRVCQPQLVLEPIDETHVTTATNFLGGFLSSVGVMVDMKDIQAGAED